MKQTNPARRTPCLAWFWVGSAFTGLDVQNLLECQVPSVPVAPVPALQRRRDVPQIAHLRPHRHTRSLCAQMEHTVHIVASCSFLFPLSTIWEAPKD